MSNRTFVLIKPEGVERGLVGKIITRLEEKGLHLDTISVMTPERKLVETHYNEHIGKEFYQRIVDHLAGQRCVAMVWRNPDQGNAVFLVRNLMGQTDPVTATPGTIRGDFGSFIGKNVIHGSDSPAAAEREINLWFPQ